VPRIRPARLFGGNGTGVRCAVCGEVIKPQQTEFEVEFNRHGIAPGIDRYRLHSPCLRAWEAERAAADPTS